MSFSVSLICCDIKRCGEGRTSFIEFSPLHLITLIAPTPYGVAIAQISSYIIMPPDTTIISKIYKLKKI